MTCPDIMTAKEVLKCCHEVVWVVRGKKQARILRWCSDLRSPVISGRASNCWTEAFPGVCASGGSPEGTAKGKRQQWRKRRTAEKGTPYSWSAVLWACTRCGAPMYMWDVVFECIWCPQEPQQSRRRREGWSILTSWQVRDGHSVLAGGALHPAETTTIERTWQLSPSPSGCRLHL